MRSVNVFVCERAYAQISFVYLYIAIIASNDPPKCCTQSLYHSPEIACKLRTLLQFHKLISPHQLFHTIKDSRALKGTAK